MAERYEVSTEDKVKGAEGRVKQRKTVCNVHVLEMVTEAFTNYVFIF